MMEVSYYTATGLLKTFTLSEHSVVPVPRKGDGLILGGRYYKVTGYSYKYNDLGDVAGIDITVKGWV